MAIRTEAQAIPGILPGKVGVWWFLASEIMLFGGLIASFIVFRLGSAGWHGEAAHLSAPIGAFNTLVLLTSSLTMVQAFASVERGDQWGFRTHLALTILLGLTFLDRKSTRLNSSHSRASRMPSSA